MILNSLLDSLHQIVFINIGETSELFLRISEVLTHNNSGARGDPTQLCFASVTNSSQLNKGAQSHLGGVSIPHGAPIPSHPTIKSRPSPGRLGREVTCRPMTPAAHHACVPPPARCGWARELLAEPSMSPFRSGTCSFCHFAAVPILHGTEGNRISAQGFTETRGVGCTHQSSSRKHDEEFCRHIIRLFQN